MTKTEKKKMAQALIMHQLSGIGYGTAYEDFKKEAGEEADTIIMEQMNRIAKLMGYKYAWFS